MEKYKNYKNPLVDYLDKYNLEISISMFQIFYKIQKL